MNSLINCKYTGRFIGAYPNLKNITTYVIWLNKQSPKPFYDKIATYQNIKEYTTEVK